MTSETIHEAKTSTDSATSNGKYNRLVGEIIDQLEKGVVPWEKPWASINSKNAVTGHPYRGWNVLILMTGATPFWITYNQAKKFRDDWFKKHNSRLNGKGEMIGIRPEELKNYKEVFFWSVSEREDEDGETKKAFFMRTYKVYNISQGFWPEEFLSKLESGKKVAEIVDAEQLVQKYADGLPEINFGGNRAYYRPSSDQIQMPPINQFKNSDGYYSTLFHELVHSTGHENRLNRTGVAKEQDGFGGDNYSREELVAELGSTFLCAETQITKVIENSTAYIASWLKALKNDPRMVIQAASAAQKAAEWVAGTKPAGREERKWKI